MSIFESLILIVGILSPIWVVLIAAIVMTRDERKKK